MRNFVLGVGAGVFFLLHGSFPLYFFVRCTLENGCFTEVEIILNMAEQICCCGKRNVVEVRVRNFVFFSRDMSTEG